MFHSFPLMSVAVQSGAMHPSESWAKDGNEKTTVARSERRDLGIMSVDSSG